MQEDKKLLELAELVLDKLRSRVEGGTPAELSPQALKYVTGVMKDLKDIRSGNNREEGVVTVVFEGPWEAASE